MPDDLRPPFRQQFDNARDPYSARNALGITGSGGGTPGPAGPPGPTGPTGPTGPAGVVTANAPLSLVSGTLSIDLSAYSTTAQIATAYQPLDADLAAIAALTGTDTIYYRSGASTWSPVTVSTGLSFTGGILTATGGAGSFVLKAGDTMTGPLQMPPGSVTDNSIRFGTTLTSGISGTNSLIAFSTTGTKRVEISSADVTFTPRISAAAGAVGAASIHFGTSNTGFYGTAAPDIRATVGAANKLILSGTALTMTVPVVLPANPTNNLEAATKQYVDGLVSGSTATVAVQTFTASGTYTPMAGMTYAIVECVGGGGGGGGAYAAAGLFNFSGGGGSGAYSRRLLTAAQVGASQTVTIGAAGTAGTASTTPTAGGNGGDTSVGTLVVAKAGLGGKAAGGTGTGAPGAGGSGSAGTGDIKASGAPGGGGSFGNGSVYGVSNEGGSSFLGGGGALTTFLSDSTAGVDATNYGSGGSGGSSYNGSARAGGAGSPGFVIITEYK